MDEQRIQDRVSATAEKVGTMASEAAKQAGTAIQGRLGQGKAMMQDAQASAATLARQATEAGRQAMADERFVATRAIRDAVKGHEIDILDKLGIDWNRGKSHIHCPYPDHNDNHPSWRWDERKARAYCTCIEKSHGIFDIVI